MFHLYKNNENLIRLWHKLLHTLVCHSVASEHCCSSLSTVQNGWCNQIISQCSEILSKSWNSSTIKTSSTSVQCENYLQFSIHGITPHFSIWLLSIRGWFNKWIRKRIHFIRCSVGSFSLFCGESFKNQKHFEIKPKIWWFYWNEWVDENHLKVEIRYLKKLLCKIGANANNSTSTIMYKKLNRKIEKFSKLLYRIVMGSIIYGFLLPPIGLGLINYYVLDKQDESFELPTPMM